MSEQTGEVRFEGKNGTTTLSGVPEGLYYVVAGAVVLAAGVGIGVLLRGEGGVELVKKGAEMLKAGTDTVQGLVK